MANTFIWIELSTPNPDAAAIFYRAVVGWSVQAYEGGDGYWQFSAGERTTAGMMPSPPEAHGATPSWVGYIGVPDVDAEAARIRRDGGVVHVPPTDIPDVGRFAKVADPQGVVFMLLTPLPREVPPPVALGTPGHVGWHELHTTDWRAAFDFYSAHFGWAKGEAMEMGAMGTYQILTIDGVQSGAMMNSPLPRPQWMHYFNVADIDAAHAAILQGGGRLMHGPSEVPDDRFIIQAIDPQGAVFAVSGPRHAGGARR
jgi:predicted enzyme related to lactoylglutathione lyase